MRVPHLVALHDIKPLFEREDLVDFALISWTACLLTEGPRARCWAHGPCQRGYHNGMPAVHPFCTDLTLGLLSGA